MECRKREGTGAEGEGWGEATAREAHDRAGSEAKARESGGPVSWEAVSLLVP